MSARPTRHVGSAVRGAIQHAGRLVAISGAHRSHPQVTALRVIQRRIVALGRSEGGVREALALARALAVIGYRSDREFEQRFAAAPRVDPQQARFAVEDYFDAIGPRFVARFCPTAYLRLSESIDLQQVDPAAITVPTDLVAVREDQIVPEADLYTLVEGLRGRSRLHRIESLYGHDAFLKEESRIGAILRDALSGVFPAEPTTSCTGRNRQRHPTTAAVRSGIDRRRPRRGGAADRAVSNFSFDLLRWQAPLRLHLQRQPDP